MELIFEGVQTAEELKKEAAEKVREAVSNLNEAIANAENNGLTVAINPFEGDFSPSIYEKVKY